MPPKDKELFGITEIYLGEDEISASNPFGFSLNEPVNELKEMHPSSSFTIEGSVVMSEDIGKFFLCEKDYCDMICIHIDGLKYSFSDGKSTIIAEFREVTDEIRKIEIGSKCLMKINQ